jgi:hypothetical protein
VRGADGLDHTVATATTTTAAPRRSAPAPAWLHAVALGDAERVLADGAGELAAGVDRLVDGDSDGVRCAAVDDGATAPGA